MVGSRAFAGGVRRPGGPGRPALPRARLGHRLGRRARRGRLRAPRGRRRRPRSVLALGRLLARAAARGPGRRVVGGIGAGRSALLARPSWAAAGRRRARRVRGAGAAVRERRGRVAARPSRAWAARRAAGAAPALRGRCDRDRATLRPARGLQPARRRGGAGAPAGSAGEAGPSHLAPAAGRGAVDRQRGRPAAVSAPPVHGATARQRFCWTRWSRWSGSPPSCPRRAGPCSRITGSSPRGPAGDRRSSRRQGRATRARTPARALRDGGRGPGSSAACSRSRSWCAPGAGVRDGSWAP
jgi:hypothetical protein